MFFLQARLKHVPYAKYAKYCTCVLFQQGFTCYFQLIFKNFQNFDYFVVQNLFVAVGILSMDKYHKSVILDIIFMSGCFSMLQWNHISHQLHWSAAGAVDILVNDTQWLVRFCCLHEFSLNLGFTAETGLKKVTLAYFEFL